MLTTQVAYEKVTVMINGHRRKAYRMTNKWRPISTAPKDGTEVLVCGHGYREISIARYVRNKWVGCCDGSLAIEAQGDCYTDYFEPYVTHWQELPQASGVK